MNTWWKKALAGTVVWIVVVVGVGMLLAANASSQYAADRITLWVLPVLLLGTVGVWVAASRARKRR